MGAEASGVVFANLQHHTAIPFLAAGQRLRLPLVANVASWDHTVGKGVIPAFLDRYVVQNAAMAEDLVRYHRVPDERIEVAGWPQTDVFACPRPREDFDALVGSLGLDPALPLVVYMGNTPTNMPWEGRFVDLLLARYEASGARRRYGLLVRPHPRDADRATRFARAEHIEAAALMEPGYDDLDRLALLLRYCACVVSNAGTVLLDAIVNDRPTVCMLSDEGAPAGERWAEKSVVGEHYRELMASAAFMQARSLDAVLDAVDDALRDPGRMAGERRAVVARVVGPVDGHAANRTAYALARGLAR
jgi:CDP-glycerol glycerophosphotransferase (TagB/SpsB family)